MAASYLSYGECFPDFETAVADYLSHQPLVVQSGEQVRLSTLQSFNNTNTSVGLTSKSFTITAGDLGQSTTTFGRLYQCEMTDPISELFPGYTADDYMEAGWLVAGSWITVWLIMLALKARRY
uniref:Uncharacterized protein n=1 Tax=viral metagenome TaxID=1070528 RepID=A0A6H1Z740_9ZZZZ